MFNNNPNKMSVKFFNRHEVFTPELLDYHADTISKVEMIKFKQRDINDGNKPFFKSILNKLNGIYDGVLYSDLIELADNLTIDAKMRIYGTIALIESSNPYTKPSGIVHFNVVNSL